MTSEHETRDSDRGTGRSPVGKFTESQYLLPASILISAIILAGAWMYTAKLKTQGTFRSNTAPEQEKASRLEEAVAPYEGVALPVSWGNLGARLVSVGAIDAARFTALYEGQGTFSDEYRDLLLGENNGRLKMTRANAGYLLNLFWALGLASKNPILDTGEMTDRAYGGAENFASTAGWTMAAGNAMDHYSRHMFFPLSAEQQSLVDKVSRGIYRPCCGNSVHFPDCNHGMAMLGLLELMASQGVSEKDMWETALAVNSYWYPDTYLTIAAYLGQKGIGWDEASPEEVLGSAYSSSSGYAKVASQVSGSGRGSGGGCGVDAGVSSAPASGQNGCDL